MLVAPDDDQDRSYRNVGSTRCRPGLQLRQGRHRRQWTTNGALGSRLVRPDKNSNGVNVCQSNLYTTITENRGYA